MMGFTAPVFMLPAEKPVVLILSGVEDTLYPKY